jgi:hypothetical protein
MALFATAYERPGEAEVLARLRRACELWNEGEKALAHIHLAHANLLECDEDRASRLFVADELLESGVTPAALMKAQGFDPALLKFNPDQPRVPNLDQRNQMVLAASELSRLLLQKTATLVPVSRSLAGGAFSGGVPCFEPVNRL